MPARLHSNDNVCGLLQAGITLADWFIHETERVYARLRRSEKETDALAIIPWLRSRGGTTTARQMTQHLQRFRGKSAYASETLQQLVKMGKVTLLDAKPGKAGGRPSEVFRLFDDDETAPAKGKKGFRRRRWAKKQSKPSARYKHLIERFKNTKSGVYEVHGTPRSDPCGR